MSQQAEIKHRHCMTYNKLESDVNSAKQLLLSHHHHHKSPLSSISSICYLFPSGWPPTSKNGLSSIHQPKNKIQHLKKIPFKPFKVLLRLFIKPLPYNICYATHLFKFKEAEMAFQVAKRLEKIKGIIIFNKPV